jgi:hypothetical protein
MEREMKAKDDRIATLEARLAEKDEKMKGEDRVGSKLSLVEECL